MSAPVLVHIAAACIGIIGSLFFTVGILRQSISAMAAISSTYWNSNPHMIAAVAAQRADYIFGGGLIVLAFSAQFTSFLVPPDLIFVHYPLAARVPWIALAITSATFILLRLLAQRLARHYETQIRDQINNRTAKQRR